MAGIPHCGSVNESALGGPSGLRTTLFIRLAHISVGAKSRRGILRGTPLTSAAVVAHKDPVRDGVHLHTGAEAEGQNQDKCVTCHWISSFCWL